MMPALFISYFNGLRNKGYTDQFIIELLLEAGESATKPSLRFVQTIGDRWEKDGIYSRFQSKEKKVGGSSKVAKTGQAARQNIKSAEEDEEQARRWREEFLQGESFM